MKKIDTTTNLWNLNLFSSTKEDLLIHLKDHLEEGSGLVTVGTPNPEQVVLSKQEPEFLTALQKLDILLPDGIGLVLASRFLAKKQHQSPLKQKITGVDMVAELCQWATIKDQPILVVGGRDYQSLTKYCPTATWVEGYGGANNPTDEEEASLTAAIKKTKPVIVFVALGAPTQEKWILAHQHLLAEQNVKLAMVVGGSFDALLGKVNRAPKVVQNLGFEWLYRLIQEPWRWKRQLRLIEFVNLVWKEART